MYGLSQAELESIQRVCKEVDIKRAILFGSRAKGNYKKGSDIDLAVIGDEKKLSYILNEETTLPYFFDVINFNKITNKNLLEHIKRVGQIIYEAK